LGRAERASRQRPQVIIIALIAWRCHRAIAAARSVARRSNTRRRISSTWINLLDFAPWWTQWVSMGASTTLTVRLTAEVTQQLGHLAKTTHRAKSLLAAEAIAAYVAREADIVDRVENGLKDMRAGRLVPHDQAIAALEATVAAAERRKD
jgi:predicted transcriptional regulator